MFVFGKQTCVPFSVVVLVHKHSQIVFSGRNVVEIGMIAIGFHGSVRFVAFQELHISLSVVIVAQCYEKRSVCFGCGNAETHFHSYIVVAVNACKGGGVYFQFIFLPVAPFAIHGV